MTESGVYVPELTQAVATGSRCMVDKLISEGVDLDTPGHDGSTPLCVAALWGNEYMVKHLLQHGANINAQNEGTGWTALHASAFQQHGKIVRFLLQKEADPKIEDTRGRTPSDYASISQAIWPFFAAAGCSKSSKARLIEKEIIRKVEDEPQMCESPSKSINKLEEFSRPGSAYVRVDQTPFMQPRRRGSKKQLEPSGPVDLLAGSKMKTNGTSRRPSLNRGQL